MLRTIKYTCMVLLLQCSICGMLAVAEQPVSGPPSGQVVYSKLVGRWLPGTDTSGGYQLFLLRTPGQSRPINMEFARKGKRGQLGAAVWYPVFSPDGKQVLFTANSSRGNVDLDLLESPTYRRQGLNLFRAATVSGHLDALTTDGNGYDHFTWSPDGKWVAAVQIGSPPYDQLYAWDLMKSKRHLLTKRPKEESITDAFWSVDGKKVVFQIWPSSGQQDPSLYAVPREGGKPRILIKGRGNRSSYSFSPNGRHVAFVQDGAVHTAGADGSKAMPVMRTAKVEGHAKWSRPRWSPNSQRLAAAEVISDTAGTVYETRLHIYDQSTQHYSIVATVKENVTSIEWSKNQQWLIITVLRTGQTDKPDPKTGWYMFRREGLLAASIANGQAITLKEPDEETKGIDWSETGR